MKFTKRIRASTIQQIPHHPVETKGSILCSQNHNTCPGFEALCMQSIPSHPFHVRSIKYYLPIYVQVLQIVFYLHSAVGLATRYGLYGPGLNPGGGRDFPHQSRPALGPTQPPVI